MTLACTRVPCSRAAKSIIHGKIRFSVLPLCTHGSSFNWCGGVDPPHNDARIAPYGAQQLGQQHGGQQRHKHLGSS